MKDDCGSASFGVQDHGTCASCLVCCDRGFSPPWSTELNQKCVQVRELFFDSTVPLGVVVMWRPASISPENISPAPRCNSSSRCLLCSHVLLYVWFPAVVAGWRVGVQKLNQSAPWVAHRAVPSTVREERLSGTREGSTFGRTVSCTRGDDNNNMFLASIPSNRENKGQRCAGQGYILHFGTGVRVALPVSPFPAPFSPPPPLDPRLSARDPLARSSSGEGKTSDLVWLFRAVRVGVPRLLRAGDRGGSADEWSGPALLPVVVAGAGAAGAAGAATYHTKTTHKFFFLRECVVGIRPQLEGRCSSSLSPDV